MTRLILILTTLSLAACSPEQQSAANNVAAALGVEQAQVFTADTVEPVVTTAAEPVVEPSSSVEPPCENYVWRAWLYDCHGNNLGPIE